MKKILSLTLAFLLSATSLCFSMANASSDDDYISVPIIIPDNDYTRKAYTDFGDKFAVSWNMLGAARNALISIDDFKGNTEFNWKNPWQKDGDGNFLDSDNRNILIHNGIEYNMFVAPSGNFSGGTLDLGGNLIKRYSVTPGNYEFLSILANGVTGIGYGTATTGLPLGVVLEYSDGTQEYKLSEQMFSAFYNSAISLSFWNGFSVPTIEVSTVSGETVSGTEKVVKAKDSLYSDVYCYINPYKIPVDFSKELTAVVFVGGNTKATLESNGKYSFSQQNGTHSGNVFAVTAVTSKAKIAQSLKAEAEKAIANYQGQNINTNSAYYNAVKSVYDDSVSGGISPSLVFGSYVPKISAMQISGTYGEGNALSISKTVSDTFRRTVTLSDIKWYKSDTITTDETAWTQISTGETYTMQASDVGSYIYVTAVPTCEAVSGIPEIKTTGDRKISNVFFRIVAPEAKYAYFKADRGIESTYAGEEISLNYGYEDLNGDIESGTVFTFEKSSKINGEYTAVQTSTDNKYVVKADDLNCFVRCKVKVKNTAEKGDEATEKISENVYFVQDDKTSFGTKLFGEYGENKNVIVLRNEALENGVKDVSAYEWYTTDKMTNAFPEGWIRSSENTQLFNISSDIFGKYVAVVVTPKTEKNGVVTEGDKIVKYFYSQQSPVAYDVKITSDNTDAKNTKSGDKLTGTYKYADPNGDSENGTKVLFEKSADGENWETLIEDVSTYELTEDDTDMYIRFSVIPKSGEEHENTGEKTSSESFVTPFAPEVTNPTISGTASTRNTLTASYTFSDKNGNADVDSEIKWYAVTSSGKTLLGTGKFYAVNSSDYGKSIIFEVTPKTNVKPLSGATVASASVAVTGGYVYGGSISTGSGGGGSSYKGTATTPNEIPQYTPVEKEKIFYDIESHWAEEAILSANEKGYMTGYEKKFRPDDSITRAEICAVVCRVLGLEKEFSESFSDVTSDLWYAGYVGSLYNAKIVSGSGDDFYPGNNVTREEFAKIIVEAYKYKNNVNNVTRKDLADFSDSNEISQWATDYVEQACGLGLFTGDTFGRFNPKAPLTRAEACVITERFSNLK